MARRKNNRQRFPPTVTLIANSFWTPLLALDRLNSWLRSDKPFSCRARSELKAVIYWTKTHAILETSKRYHIGMRRVMVKTRCRRCSGTGQWYSFYDFAGEYPEPCRGCRATGTATLKFIETTLGPIRWHTPAERWYMSSLDDYIPFPSFYGGYDSDEHYELAEGWEPNKPGRPMALEDALRDMLIILRAWPHEVAFALDFHHHAGIERQWKQPDVRKAEAWLAELFSRP